MAVKKAALVLDVRWRRCVLVVIVLSWAPCAVLAGQYDNVALYKTCTMSSTWSGTPTYYQNPQGTQLAVDGNIDYSSSGYGCVHSGYGDYSCYWQVDLGRPYSIHKMVSFGRSTFFLRMGRVVVTVDEQPCFVYPDGVYQREYHFSCTSGIRTGTRVRLSKYSQSNDPHYTINLCEFQVLTCTDGFWGPTCDYTCGACSQDAPVCDKISGECQTCQSGWKTTTPNLCTQACDDGTYGPNCTSQCSVQCSDVCNKANGYCTCKPGYRGDRCDTECADGTWGLRCQQLCGQGCSATCDKVSGTCSCSPGWQPPNCFTECPYGKYGQDCANDCSIHCSNYCDKKNGSCTCNPGYQPPNCITACPEGFWGENCQQKCSENCADVCNHVTGHCSCSPGWRGDRCEEECWPGTYGQNCQSQCGKCEQGTFCHHVTGHCSKCQQFYNLPLCTECVDYKYGQDCSQDCSANCQSVCEKDQGHCTCKPGWQEPRCVQECEDGTYGLRCEERCGNCSNGLTECSHETGDCPLGCISGWAPPLCQEALKQEGGGGGGGGSDIGPIVGAVVGVVVVAALVVVIVLIIRRRGGFKKNGSSEESLEASSSAIINGGGINRKQASFSNRDNIYQNVVLDPPKAGGVDEAHRGSDIKPKPTTAVKPTLTKPSSPSDMAATTSIYENSPTTKSPSRPPSIPTSRTSHPHTSSREADAAEAEDVDDDHRITSDVYYNDDTYVTSEAAQLGLDSTQEYLLNRLRAKDLDAEFEKLQKGLVREHEAGSAEENYFKNRFKTILPYDDNRVVLQGATHAGANDYINASFVRGWKSEKAYIASQGPRPNTMEDMWWLVWQEKVHHIVMLTSVMEADKKKCAEYWPALGAEKKYGSVCVRGTTLQKRADYVIRTFDVKEASGGSSRKVTHFHFVTWPDHDVPSVTSLVDFWSSVSWSYRNQQSATAPLLVHCSAGVGRTGAFIALDKVMQQTQHSESVSMQQTAAQLRQDRCHMIQTKAQYRLVHEAVLEAYSSQNCRTLVSSVDSMPQLDPLTPCPAIDPLFQKLQQTKVLLKKPCLRTAEDNENVNKNRDINVLPDDNHVVFLKYHIKGRNQYVNAVYTPTFFQRRGCIMTQLPLKNTVIDFWRLVAGDEVTTVISLGGEVDKMEAGECYWPTEEGQKVTHGPFQVVLQSASSLGTHLKSYHMTLSAEEGEGRDVRLLHYSGWPDQLPQEMTDLLQLLCIMTENDAGDERAPPLLLQCRDGAVRSGLIRVIADVISRMTSDGQVDVYTAVKHVQNARPQTVTKMEEFRFIYSVLQRYRESNNVYQNT